MIFGEQEEVLDSYLVLYGDGVHDDTDAFLAYLRGEVVIFNPTNEFIRREGEKVLIPYGTYLIKSTLNLDTEDS